MPSLQFGDGISSSTATNSLGVSVAGVAMVMVMLVTLSMLLVLCSGCEKKDKPTTLMKKSTSPTLDQSTLDSRFGSMAPTKAFEGRKNNPLFNSGASSAALQSDLSGKRKIVQVNEDRLKSPPTKQSSNNGDAAIQQQSSKKKKILKKKQPKEQQGLSSDEEDEDGFGFEPRRTETRRIDNTPTIDDKTEEEPTGFSRERNESFSGFGFSDPPKKAKSKDKSPLLNDDDDYLKVGTMPKDNATNAKPKNSPAGAKSQPERIKEKATAKDKARAERLAKMKATRSKKADVFKKSLEDALSIIDNLSD